jgi:uncharacterized protein (DUF1800 family)
MRLRLSYIAAAAAYLAATAPALASPESPTTFATTYVASSVPRGHAGTDAGVEVTGGRYVRITASGTIALGGYSSCGRATHPDGCSAAFSPGRIAPAAATGSLVAAFTSASGQLISGWAAIGMGGYVAVPQGAARMVLRINGTTGHELGAFRVVTDVVANAAAATSGVASSSTAQVGGVRRTLSAMRTVSAAAISRSDVQYVLRRFGFGDTPANVNAVYKSGVSGWIAQQLSPSTIDDSALSMYMEPTPLYGTGPSTNNGYDYYGNILQRQILQREIATKRQLLEKMTLHWLEHFAVSEDKVGDPGAMAHYEATVRTDALGNFATLVSDVSVEPAMLFWLDNNNNNGANPTTNPPNENFGREVMQLYIIGTTMLNNDGTPVMDPNTGLAKQTYNDLDVKQAAQAFSGFQVTEPPNPGAVNPLTVDSVKFYKTRHGSGPFTIMGQVITDTGDPTIVPKVINSIVTNPTTAPFEVTELLQRFVTETPSPGYISRIVAVWNANVNDPNQIAKVMQAIANDPEFYSGKGAMVKEPIEYVVDGVRELNGATSTPFTSTMETPYSSQYNTLGAMAQQHWYPPSVFSFYRPGNKESLLTNSLLIARWNGGANFSNETRTTTLCTTCDTNLNFTNLSALTGGSSANSITEYLLDSLVDGGTPQLSALLSNYLANGTANLRGAMWMVLTSPEYEVN